MASYDWGSSQRGLINDFQLQSYAGEGVPLSSNAHNAAGSEVEFSDIDLGIGPATNVPETKVECGTVMPLLLLLACSA